MKSNLRDILSLISGTIFEVDYSTKTVSEAYYNGVNICKDTKLDDFLSMLFDRFQCKLKAISLRDLDKWILDNSNDKNDLSFEIEKTSGECKRCKISKHPSEDYVSCLLESFENNSVYSLLDSMTGLYQKDTFSSLVNEAFLHAEKQPFYFLIIDIDNFKSVNDNYGHLFGDKIIKEIANIIKIEFKNGIVGRFGGDEFAVLAFSAVDYDTVWASVHQFSNRIRDYFSSCHPDISLGITIGCARYGIDGTTYDELFLKADKALYRGKFKSKNCFVIYDDSLYSEVGLSYKGDSRSYLYNTKVELQFFVDLFYFLASCKQFDEALHGVVHNIRKYFMLDRAIIYIQETYRAKLRATSCVTNPLANPICLEETFNPNLWVDHLTHYACKMNYVGNIETINKPLYLALSKENVVSVYLLELIHDDQIVGYLRLDKCIEKRRWVYKEDDILQAVSNVLATYIYLHREK